MAGKKTPAKKTPAKAAARKKPAQPRAGQPGKQRTRRNQSRRKTAGGRGAVDERAAKKVPSGPAKSLTVAQRMLRDTRMLTRLAQGWSIAAIAAEAGIKEDAARDAIEKRRVEYPLVLSLDPVRVVEEIALGLQLSIADFQALAAAGAESGNISAAVGAQKGANDARAQVLQLLQDVGRLPTDFSQMKHLLELREIGERMVGSIRTFREVVAELPVGEEVRVEIDAAAAEVEETFVELIDPSKEAPAIEAAA